jgi:hypothetical protein
MSFFDADRPSAPLSGRAAALHQGRPAQPPTPVSGLAAALHQGRQHLSPTPVSGLAAALHHKANLNLGPPPGTIIMAGMTETELANFAIIPEDAKNKTDTPLCTHNGEYKGDGFYCKSFTTDRYWFKVSAGGKVTVKMSSDRKKIITSSQESSFWRWIADKKGVPYVVGWQSKNQPHWTHNPFDK